MRRYSGQQAAPSAPLLPSTSAVPYTGTPAVAVSAALGSTVSNEIARAVDEVQRDNGCTVDKRDYLLQYAHSAYSSGTQDIDLLPLLHMLDNLHPGHCPTLLLLSCVYYSKGIKGDLGPVESKRLLESSIAMNSKILQKDPTYVEALSNIGTTFRALGNAKEAEAYWYKAIKIRPHYFDSVENLLGVLCHPQTDSHGNSAGLPRYEEALQLCDYVEAKIFGEHCSRPYLLPASIPTQHIHRLQNLFYAKGNLQTALQKPLQAKEEYEKGVEIVLSNGSSKTGQATDNGIAYTVTELLLACVLVGLLLMGQQAPGSQQEVRAQQLLSSLHIPVPSDGQALVGVDYLKMARKNRQAVLQILQQLGGGYMPMILILPGVLPELKKMLFIATDGLLPAIYASSTRSSNGKRVGSSTVEQTSQTTSTLLLTLAKTFQEAMQSPQGPVARDLLAKGISANSSTTLPLYYLALALHPSPSTYNNLGILLSTVSANAIISISTGQVVCSGQSLAMQFYKAGLDKDNKHPHLYTNLGSLYKDMGNLPYAIEMYKKAVECNQNFDVALANLANAIKDLGQVQESIPWYYKAVKLNPDFPEAVCGLVNALGGVCDWHNRGGVGDDLAVGEHNELLDPRIPQDVEKAKHGWMPRIVHLVSKQLEQGSQYGRGIVRATGGGPNWLQILSISLDIPAASLQAYAPSFYKAIALLSSGRLLQTTNEGGLLIRLVERLMRRSQRRWYVTTYGKTVKTSAQQRLPRIQIDQKALHLYARPPIPPTLSHSPVPTVLPFHTFTYPLTARQTRLISHRNALRISYSTLTQPWLPQSVYPPPPPPSPKLRIGYVSSDFNNHPLAHLMQSVFGMHDLSRFEIYCYATTASDQSEYRHKIEAEAQHFIDVSAWSNQAVVERVVADGIHILVNMNGYTKGAKNEIFAARPCPIQIQQLMGFAGTLASGWCDWIIADQIIIPPDTVSGEVWRKRLAMRANEHSFAGAFEGDLDPEEESNDWSYTEKIAYVPKTYFVTDHKQGFRDEIPQQTFDRQSSWVIDEQRRWQMRKELFPQCRDDTVIFCCLNQLYKIDPLIFKTWLDILAKVPNSILWLLRFPAPGEKHLKQTAEEWSNAEIASRIVFTDVAPKQLHIARGRIGDLFLDSTEVRPTVGGHTTSADVLWSGTPVLTFPRHKHKLCSRVAASIAYSTGFGSQMVVNSMQDYENRAVQLAMSLKYTEDKQGSGELYDLRRNLFHSREESPLFNTLQWTRNAENAYEEMWRRWVEGTEFEDSPEWQACNGPEKASGCIFLSE